MSEFTEYLKEVFASFGAVQIKRMFGGHGIFFQGLMIGLVADDVLYLKADAQSEHLFEALELPQFSYPKKDKMIKMSYFQAPESIYDEADEAAIWAQHALEAAQRADARKPRKQKKA